MRTRPLRTLAAVLALVLSAAACSSSSKSSTGSSATTTTQSSTTTPKNFQLTTDSGQVSLSLSGQLPPGWPSGFPVPTGATPAGSGSLVGSSQGALVAVYSTSASGSDTFDFYRNNSSLTVKNPRSLGIGSAFVGNMGLGGSYSGSVTITALGGSGTYVVVVLTNSGASSSTTTTGSSETTTSST